MKTLAELLPGVGLAPELAVQHATGLASDSRKVQPGFLFFAVPGAKADGGVYATDAAARGALAMVAEGDVLAPMPCIEVPDVRASLAHAAALFHPRQPGTIVAITGTSGKTSIASFVRQIWTRLGHQAASVGTLGTVSPQCAHYGTLTTPDPIGLHESLGQLAAEGVTHLAIEASSHGLDQRRLDGVRLVAGAFTNLSRDHLDYHGTFEHYLAAKLRLFDTLLQPGQPAVVDADSDVSQQVIDACHARGLRVFTTGLRGQDLQLLASRPDGYATQLNLVCGGQEYAMRLPLAGLFQTANALVAAGLCIATGSEAGAVLAALEQLTGAPGRLEHAGEFRGGQIFIDYAHKPDALAKALQAVRPFVRQSLIVVVGCGGDRDVGKRPIMGEIATQNADVVIITDDNPRSEDPAKIRAAVLARSPDALEIGDRREAIRTAIHMLREGDLVLIAGKGHETGQIVGDKVLAFSDHEVVADVLGELPL